MLPKGIGTMRNFKWFRITIQWSYYSFKLIKHGLTKIHDHEFQKFGPQHPVHWNPGLIGNIYSILFYMSQVWTCKPHRSASSSSSCSWHLSLDNCFASRIQFYAMAKALIWLWRGLGWYGFWTANSRLPLKEWQQSPYTFETDLCTNQWLQHASTDLALLVIFSLTVLDMENQWKLSHDFCMNSCSYHLPWTNQHLDSGMASCGQQLSTRN